MYYKKASQMYRKSVQIGSLYQSKKTDQNRGCNDFFITTPVILFVVILNDVVDHYIKLVFIKAVVICFGNGGSCGSRLVCRSCI